MTTSQPACQCLINPGWKHNPDIRLEWDKPHFCPPSVWASVPPEPHKGLTLDEQAVLANLVASWNLYLALGNHTSDDIQEFRDSIHRCQQLVALRVARRVDPGVWCQPEEKPDQDTCKK